jgi:catechol 2,3-dioxygenase-like lactoylglutathione lyase family enzyme
MSKLTLRAAMLVLAFVPMPASAQTGFAAIVDHLHLAAPDQAKAVAWYHEHFGGETMTEGPDRLMFGETRVIFQRAESPQPSVGSVLDHVGFSVPDIEATLRALQTAGVKIVDPVRDVTGLFKLAFVEDPWGTRIEIVQDPQKLGLHHVHLRAPDPATTLGWYVATFGGRIEQFKNRLDGVNYGGVWLLATRGDAAPSRGHAIDHIGFRPVNVDNAVATLKARKVTIESEPRQLTLPSGTAMRIAFIEGPDAVRIELVQR